MSEYGFGEESSSLVPRKDPSHGFIKVIPVEFQNRRTYSDYESYGIRRSPVPREVIRERAQNELLRQQQLKNSIDNVDKTGGFYPLTATAYDINLKNSYDLAQRNLNASNDIRRRLSQRSTPTHPRLNAGNTQPQQNTLNHTQNTATLESREKITQVKKEPDRELSKIPGQKLVKPEPSIRTEFCVYFHSRLAFKVHLEDGLKITAQNLLQIIIDEEDMKLPKEASQVFALWMISPLLEIQLKPHHRPLELRRQWAKLLRKFGQIPTNEKEEKYAFEPKLVFRRNVFFTKKDEMKIGDTKMLELLYEEAQWNMKTARYPCELSDYEMLAGIRAWLKLGAYDHNTHTPSFFTQRLLDYLPEHACVLKCSDFLSFSSKSTPEVRVIEQFRSIPNNVSGVKLVRKYLEFIWSLPYYGSAFFNGQIEAKRKGVFYMISSPDIQVVIGINEQGLTLIDSEHSVLLNVKYDEFSWDFAKPSQENSDCLPCLFLQFSVIENSKRYSKVLQIFSKQAVMMDALINTFVADAKKRASQFSDDLDGQLLDQSLDSDDVLAPLSTISRKDVSGSVMCDKVDRLCLSTFSEDGHLLNVSGSFEPFR